MLAFLPACRRLSLCDANVSRAEARRKLQEPASTNFFCSQQTEKSLCWKYRRLYISYGFQICVSRCMFDSIFTPLSLGQAWLTSNLLQTVPLPGFLYTVFQRLYRYTVRTNFLLLYLYIFIFLSTSSSFQHRSTMSTNNAKTILASVAPVEPSFSDRVECDATAMDTEMTGPLTVHDDRGRSRSSSLTNEEMSNFTGSRNGGGNTGGNGTNGGNGNIGRSNNNAGNNNITRNSRYYRSNTTNENWRPTNDRSGQFMGPSRSASYNPNDPLLSSSFPPGPQLQASRGGNQIQGNSIPLSNVSPGAAWPTDQQLSVAYAYGYRREDGSITRLVPADELIHFSNMANIPPTQGSQGLIIVPAPQQQPPNMRIGEPMVPVEVSTTIIRMLYSNILISDYRLCATSRDLLVLVICNYK